MFSFFLSFFFFWGEGVHWVIFSGNKVIAQPSTYALKLRQNLWPENLQAKMFLQSSTIVRWRKESQLTFGYNSVFRMFFIFVC